MVEPRSKPKRHNAWHLSSTDLDLAGRLHVVWHRRPRLLSLTRVCYLVLAFAFPLLFIFDGWALVDHVTQHFALKVMLTIASLLIALLVFIWMCRHERTAFSISTMTWRLGQRDIEFESDASRRVSLSGDINTLAKLPNGNSVLLAGDDQIVNLDQRFLASGSRVDPDDWQRVRLQIARLYSLPLTLPDRTDLNGISPGRIEVPLGSTLREWLRVLRVFLWIGLAVGALGMAGSYVPCPHHDVVHENILDQRILTGALMIVGLVAVFAIGRVPPAWPSITTGDEPALHLPGRRSIPLATLQDIRRCPGPAGPAIGLLHTDPVTGELRLDRVTPLKGKDVRDDHLAALRRVVRLGD